MERIKQHKIIMVLVIALTIATTWFFISYMNAKKFGPTALFYPMSGPLFMITIPVMLTLGIVLAYFTIREAIKRNNILYWVNLVISLIFIYSIMYLNIFFYIPYISLTTSAMNTLTIVAFCFFLLLFITNGLVVFLDLGTQATKKKLREDKQ